LYGILASGRAIVAAVPKNSEVALTVEENQCGIVVPPSDPSCLAATIEKLASDRQAILEMGENARKAYLDNYRLEHAIDQFEKLWGLTPLVPTRINPLPTVAKAEIR
jgi:colanic acid biosynthesis glycosyl transferase WcaI